MSSFSDNRQNFFFSKMLSSFKDRQNYLAYKETQEWDLQVAEYISGTGRICDSNILEW